MKTTSSNICITSEYDDSIFYKAHCDCMSDKHIKTIEVRLSEMQDKFPKEIEIMFYYNVGSYPDSYITENRFLNFIYNLFYRIKQSIIISYNIIFKGNYEINDAFMLRDEKAIEDYIFALKEAFNKMKDCNKKMIEMMKIELN